MRNRRCKKTIRIFHFKMKISYQNIDGLIKGMEAKNILLQQKTEEYLSLTEKRAQAERDYHIAVAKKILIFKDAGHSVTLIRDLVKGDDMIAELKYTLDVSEGILRACIESMKDIRTAIDSYRSILSWKKAEFERT